MPTATNIAQGDVILSGDLTGSDAYNPELAPSGVSAGSYTSPHLVVDSKGRILSATAVDLTTYTVDDTTTASKGIVQIDGTYLDVTTGVLTVDSVAITSTIDATTTSKGIVQIDDVNFNITGGVVALDVNTITSATIDATTTSKGIIQIDDVNFNITGGVVALDVNTITSAINDATTTSKGIIQIDGTHLDISSGIMSMNTASDLILGIVKSADVDNIIITSGDLNVGPSVATDTSALNVWTTTRANERIINAATPDGAVSTIFDYSLASNFTLNNITSPQIGTTYTFIFRQNSTGGYIVTFDTNYKIRSTIKSVTSTPNAVSILSVYVESATNFLCILQNDFI